MATSLAAASLLFAIFFAALATLTNQSPVSNKTKGFGIGLIHRDSPLSPLHNPNATITDRWNAAYGRSRRRYANMESTMTAKKSMQALNVTVIQTDAEYLMNISIGNPPFPIMVLMDTGSSLFWVQCLPCTNCFDHVHPIYDPSKSYSSSGLFCHSDECDQLNSKFCTRDGFCGYEINYGDNSHSDGVLFKEDVIFMGVDGSPTTFGGIVFGCGSNNTGIFSKESSGIAGLGPRPLSLINQLGLNDDMPKKFSHCFVPPWSDAPKGVSHMIIGQDKGSALPDFAPWTELVLMNVDHVPFYIADLEGISVAAERLAIPEGAFFGGTTVDIGATMSVLSNIGFNALLEKLEGAITLEKETTKGKPGGLCYRGSMSDLNDVNKVPFVTLHFKGLDVPLHPLKTFMEYGSGVWCLAIYSGNTLSVIGNHALQDMYVRYDLEEMKLYMASVNCALIDDH